jgi:hypothetical protein
MDKGFKVENFGGGIEDEGRHERQWSERMTVVEEDTTMTMAADRGRKSGQVREEEGRCFYI